MKKWRQKFLREKNYCVKKDEKVTAKKNDTNQKYTARKKRHKPKIYREKKLGKKQKNYYHKLVFYEKKKQFLSMSPLLLLLLPLFLLFLFLFSLNILTFQCMVHSPRILNSQNKFLILRPIKIKNNTKNKQEDTTRSRDRYPRDFTPWKY